MKNKAFVCLAVALLSSSRDILTRQSFDVVLMDVQMPEMGGFEATAAIRERESGTGRRQPIVAMTAHALQGDRERCLNGGFDGYIAKPISEWELFMVIDRVIAESELHQAVV